MLHLDILRKFFTVKKINHWNNLPWDMVESPSLEFFKMIVDKVLNNVIWAPFPMKVWTSWFFYVTSNLYCSMILKKGCSQECRKNALKIHNTRTQNLYTQWNMTNEDDYSHEVKSKKMLLIFKKKKHNTYLNTQGHRVSFILSAIKNEGKYLKVFCETVWNM